MKPPIVLGKEAERLSDLIECHHDVWNGGVPYWVVAESSACIYDYCDAAKLAREWFPELTDDLDD